MCSCVVLMCMKIHPFTFPTADFFRVTLGFTFMYQASTQANTPLTGMSFWKAYAGVLFNAHAIRGTDINQYEKYKQHMKLDLFSRTCRAKKFLCPDKEFTDNPMDQLHLQVASAAAGAQQGSFLKVPVVGRFH